MTNITISKTLRNVAASYTIIDEKKYRFQIIAYQNAADIIEHLPTELSELYEEKRLDEIPGVGPSIKDHLISLIESGKVQHFEEIFKEIPQSVFPLLDVPGFGPKTAYKLVNEYHLKNPETVIDDIADLAKNGKIATMPGFGEKSQQRILQVIEEYKIGKTKSARMNLPYANELAKKLINYLTKSKDVIKVYPLGSLRRKKSTIGDIDIAVATNNPQAVLDYFSAYPYTERILEKGDRTSSILVSSGKQIDLMTQPVEGFGALLQHFTGSKAHNIHLREYALSQGLSLSEYGIRKKGDNESKLVQYDSEEAFYKALGLQWIPPEIREDTGEIELARQNKLPRLIELEDIKGDFHLHSNYPIEPSHDLGHNTMEEMLQKAQSLQYEYIAFSEHNPSISNHTVDQIRKIMQDRSKFIERLRLKSNNTIRIISLLEIDILTDGRLALDDKSFDYLDSAIVSIHSNFGMDKKTMTQRVLKGLSHPKAKILAHPTGRLLNQRTGYELEWNEIFRFCKQHNKALEINAWPVRLDLPDTIVRDAIKQGIKLVINTDSHAISHMDHMEYGVYVARRGWATKRDILNTLPYNELEEWLMS